MYVFGVQIRNTVLIQVRCVCYVHVICESCWHMVCTLLVSNVYNYFTYYLYYFHILIIEISPKDMVDMYVICDEYIVISAFLNMTEG